MLDMLNIYGFIDRLYDLCFQRRPGPIEVDGRGIPQEYREKLENIFTVVTQLRTSLEQMRIGNMSDDISPLGHIVLSG